MQPVYYIMIMAICLSIFAYLSSRRSRIAAVRCIQKKKHKKERVSMEALAKQFLNKKCIIYTLADTSGSVKGVIKEINDCALLVADAQDNLQVINLEYVIRIREYPKNKKGKEKSVVLD